MLLLLLFAGCLASCAAQTAPFPSSTMSPQSFNPTPVMLQADNFLAVLQTSVQSNQQLNGTTISLVIKELNNVIQGIQPGLHFSLTVKNVTKV